MQPFLQNKFVKYAGIGVIILIALFIFSVIFLSSLNDARNSSYGLNSAYAPSVSQGISMERAAGVDVYSMEADTSYYMPPEPAPSGYTADLETYETTSYSVTARTKQFDELCDTVTSLKADTQIHFKSISRSTNNCRATFFVEENAAATVLNTLNTFNGVEYTRNTTSVTRHRQQIQSQTTILQQQLASIQRSLTAAETQFDEIAEFAKENKDAATLSQAISQKLNNINTLTQQKINLVSRINNLYQQAADLEERMNVVQFDVNINRSNPIYPNQESQKWEKAWKQLSDTYTDTLIGLTAFFGIFLLGAIKYILYLLVIIVILRGLWKFIQLVWNKW